MQLMAVLLFQTALMVLLAPLFSGWVKWMKCRFQNRTAPSLLQPYRNLAKLFQKQVLLAHHASWLFRFMPYFNFSVMVVAAACVPFFIAVPGLPVLGDGIVLIGLFALTRFFLALAGLDIGTSFGGMGSSREMMVASMAEPAFLLVLLALAMVASSTNLNSIVLYLAHSPIYLRPSFIFIGLAWVMILLAETGRIPVDNPSTHLELTMIHEAMILEYTGRHLALIEWTSQLKLLIYVALLSNLFFPWGIATTIQVKTVCLAFVDVTLKSMILGAFIVLIETVLAKMRLFKAPYFLSIAFSLALLGVLSHIILEV